MRQRKLYLPVLVMIKCLCCEWDVHSIPGMLTFDIMSRWDTRTPSEPTNKIQAHDREILAVSFSPASEHLLVTGSADKVCFSYFHTALTCSFGGRP